MTVSDGCARRLPQITQGGSTLFQSTTQFPETQDAFLDDLRGPQDPMATTHEKTLGFSRYHIKSRVEQIVVRARC